MCFSKLWVSKALGSFGPSCTNYKRVHFEKPPFVIFLHCLFGSIRQQTIHTQQCPFVLPWMELP